MNKVVSQKKLVLLILNNGSTIKCIMHSTLWDATDTIREPLCRIQGERTTSYKN